jgi:hypothetical protein
MERARSHPPPQPDRVAAHARERRTSPSARGKGTAPPLPASAVADGGELLGQAAAEGRHECEEA